MSERKIGKREARRIVREHWAEYIANADCAPEGGEDVWEEECARLVRFLTPPVKGA